MGYRFWTIEEVEYLQDKWGQIETVKICKHLNRTYASVKAKVKKIGLGPARQAGTSLCASELAYSINVDKRTVDRYIQKGLKATRKRFGLGSKKNICINIEDFWRFAKKNKELIVYSPLYIPLYSFRLIYYGLLMNRNRSYVLLKMVALLYCL